MPLYGTNSEHYNSHSKISGGLCSILVLIRSYWSRYRINVGIGWSLGQSLWSYESLFNDKVVNNRTNWWEEENEEDPEYFIWDRTTKCMDKHPKPKNTKYEWKEEYTRQESKSHCYECICSFITINYSSNHITYYARMAALKKRSFSALSCTLNFGPRSRGISSFRERNCISIGFCWCSRVCKNSHIGRYFYRIH